MKHILTFESFEPRKVENRLQQKRQRELDKGTATIRLSEVAIDMDDNTKKVLDKYKPIDWIQMEVMFAKKNGKKVKELSSKLKVDSYKEYDTDGDSYDIFEVVLSGPAKIVHELTDILSNEESMVVVS